MSRQRDPRDHHHPVGDMGREPGPGSGMHVLLGWLIPIEIGGAPMTDRAEVVALALEKVSVSARIGNVSLEMPLGKS
jgi:hypothetical protein